MYTGSLQPISNSYVHIQYKRRPIYYRDCFVLFIRRLDCPTSNCSITQLCAPLQCLKIKRVLLLGIQIRHSAHGGHPHSNPPPPIGVDWLVLEEFDILVQWFDDLLPSNIAFDTAVACRLGSSGGSRRGRVQRLSWKHLGRLIGKEHGVHWRPVESVEI